jgi:hypothetical protein
VQKQYNDKGDVSRRDFLKDAGFVIGVPAAGATVIQNSFAAGTSQTAGTSQKVELELLNPMGVIDPPKMLGITPRVSTLDGKKIALIHNNKPGAKTFLDAVEELLKQKYPTAAFARFDTTINLADKPEKYRAMADSCDAFVLGSGD